MVIDTSSGDGRFAPVPMASVYAASKATVSCFAEAHNYCQGTAPTTTITEYESALEAQRQTVKMMNTLELGCFAIEGVKVDTHIQTYDPDRVAALLPERADAIGRGELAIISPLRAAATLTRLRSAIASLCSG